MAEHQKRLIRIDNLLVLQRLAPSRQKAQEWITQGRVGLIDREGHRRPIKKSSESFDPESIAELGIKLIVEQATEPEYVSRGGHKLAGAVQRLSWSVKDLIALDIGISTGGFTDCLLQNGVKQVVGVDVGHGQLAIALIGHSKLKLIEGVNARSLKGSIARSSFDLIVVDVSFISLTLILPSAAWAIKPGGRLLALVKPQFEVGKAALGKNGIVKNPDEWKRVEKLIRDSVTALGFQIADYFPSQLSGADGNQEFFIACVMPQ